MDSNRDIKNSEMKITSEELKAILADYEYNSDILCDEDERAIKIKHALTKIPLADKIIFCLQTDRKVSKILGVSYTTIFNEYKRIRNEIIDIMNNDTN